MAGAKTDRGVVTRMIATPAVSAAAGTNVSKANIISYCAVTAAMMHPAKLTYRSSMVCCRTL